MVSSVTIVTLEPMVKLSFDILLFDHPKRGFPLATSNQQKREGNERAINILTRNLSK